MVARAKKIPELASATSVSNTDLFVIEQVGANTSSTKKVTANVFASYVATRVGAISGTKGDKGDAGTAGVKGDVGTAGAKGDKGELGTVGAKGDKGELVAANTANYKFESNILGTRDNPDTGGWGGYDVYVSPNSNGAAWLSIPNDTNLANGGITTLGNLGDGGISIVTQRGELAIGANMEAPGVIEHYHIAFRGSNSTTPQSDLIVGDDFNHVKVNGGAYGVNIATNDRNGGEQYTWQFRNTGESYLGGDTVYLNPNGAGALYADANTGVVTIGDYLGSGGSPAMPGTTVAVGGVGDAFRISRAQESGPEAYNPTWIFGATGATVFPGIIDFNNYRSTIGIASIGASPTLANTFVIEAMSDVPIIVSTLDGYGRENWTFGVDGSLTFPDSTVQTTAYVAPTYLSDSLSTTLTVGAAVNAGFLSARIVESAGDVDLELKYSHPEAPTVVTMSTPTLNVFSGKTTLAANNNTWTSVGTATVPGHTIVATVADHSFQNVYRVTLVLRNNEVGNIDSYCAIEQLIKG